MGLISMNQLTTPRITVQGVTVGGGRPTTVPPASRKSQPPKSTQELLPRSWGLGRSVSFLAVPEFGAPRELLYTRGFDVFYHASYEYAALILYKLKGWI
jgi:hypothetical protein